MKTKQSHTHTPGPWKWTPDYAGANYYTLNGADGTEVIDDGSACGEYDPGIKVPDGANARLIAAAPELLEAAKAVAEGLKNDAINYPDGNFPSVDRFVNRSNRLLRAIATAEGQEDIKCGG